jgi:2-amino-4-hydroxy-6-hydroxymethyldihydropteridine diphosphokinase
MTRAVLSIGSNVGDRLATLREARTAFASWLVAASPVYRTPPWGPVPQDDFYNAVLIADDPSAGARDWLDRAHAAEEAAGRTRDVRWGPRTLDVDVVDVAGVTSGDPELTLPHPRAGERAFVLVPWLAADAEAVLAGRPVRDWVAKLADEDVAAVRIVGDLA